MNLNGKDINYKIFDLINLYHFCIKFVFIWDHMKNLWIVLHYTIFRGGWHHHPPLEMFFMGGRPYHLPMEIVAIFKGW